MFNNADDNGEMADVGGCLVRRSNGSIFWSRERYRRRKTPI